MLMLFFGALVVAGVVLLIIWAVNASSPLPAAGGGMPRPGAVGHDDAVAIAKRRPASGEITKDQYSEIMSALGG